MTSKAVEEFGNVIRLRVCGVCVKEDRMLLINHKGLYSHDFWAPPGGGVGLGESMEDALKREFREECNVDIEVGEYLFGCEFIRLPFHAVELFFEVEPLGEPSLGTDPEMEDNQIISDLRFIGSDVLTAMPISQLHGLFGQARNPKIIKGLKGFFTLT